eukprot:gene4114-4404_t
MAPNLLKTYQITIDLHQFLQLCWYNVEFYENFMVQKLQDIHVTIGTWDTSKEKNNVKTREIKCFHPSKISFPGLPSHAESIKLQTLEIHRNPNTPTTSASTTTGATTNNSTNNESHAELENIVAFHVREVNTFRGIPYADYFNVISEWKVTDNNDKGCTIQIFLDFKFHKSTWLQGTIESNTKAELLEVFEQWYEAVNHQIRTVETKRYLQKSSNHNLMRSNSGESDGVKRKEGSLSKAKQTQDIENNLPPPKLSLQEEEDEDDGYDEEDEMLPKSPHENSANTSDADDFQFYDAEDYPSDAETVFTLPQTLLLSMETSRHGCNPTSQLGNTVIISLFIWIGLSGLYRLLALLVAPSISYKNCLSVIGYSFYSWNMAILCSLPLEHYKDQLKIPILLPLVIFGLPSSICQGYMFWEHTPPSTIVLQPSVLPTSLQSIATNNSRLIQRFLWALPKIVAFIVVAGTHYQLLWYMARVFLPGRRQLCRLSALIQPSQYADILSQKEIRMFALKLLSGER